MQGGPPVRSADEIRRSIREYLRETRVERAILFGSFARGTADVASDVDLLLIEPTSEPFVERGRNHLPLFRMGIGVDLLIYSPEEFEQLLRERNPLIERVVAEGVTIYEGPER